MAVGDKLRTGRQLRLPHQQFLDAGRDAKNKSVALDLYMQTHAGHLPPNPAHPPSVSDQIAHNLDRPLRRESRNGYDYGIDVIGRTREVTGRLKRDGSQPRSPSIQARAGGSDRLPTDHGGHYVARRFGGPAEAFNHFAQDAHFNKSTYSKLENAWDKAVRMGGKVDIEITPVYPDLSQRPSAIRVTYIVNGHRERRTFSNSAGGKR